jgi:hypothetical protein
MASPIRGMILDRDLTPDLMDVALRIASDPTPWAEKRKLLTVALRDHVNNQEATGKTKKCLTKVWINPPVSATDMITWGRENCHLASDRRVLHLGALIATFPFAGAVTALVGRALSLDGQARPTDIRQRARAIWGDRSSIDVGARKVYTTLLRFGVLSGGGRAPLTRGEEFQADTELAGWLIHSVLLTRGITSVSVADLSAAPELFWVKLIDPAGPYPLLTRHTEGGRRMVWALTP